MSLRRPFLWLIGGLLLAALACGAPAPTPAPVDVPAGIPSGPSPTPPPLAGTPVAIDSRLLPPAQPFAPYVANPANTTAGAPGYPFDLNNIANPNDVALTAAQRTALAADGFVLAPAGTGAPASLPNLYRAAQAAGQPLFITAGWLLQTTHALHRQAVQQAEQDYLAADLQALSEALVAASEAQMSAAGEEAVSMAARQNLAFFSVGASLLAPDFAPPEAVAGVVAEELALIRQAGAAFISPLRGELYDYAVYAPAGTGAAHTGYAQAMTWYGQTLLPTSPAADVAADPATLRLAARQVLLLLAALRSTQNESRWERVYTPSAYFHGQDGALSPAAAGVAAQAVYGAWPAPDALADEAQLDNFVVTLGGLATRPGLRFMPWATRPDAHIFPELVFNRVGSYNGPADPLPFTALSTNIGPVRALPRGLDVAAVLGSRPALDYLQAAGDTAYEGYAAQVTALAAPFAALDEAGWTQDWPSGWLYGLQPLAAPAEPGRPSFMQTAAWTGQQLGSWFGGWALLRRPAGEEQPAAEPEGAFAGAVGYVEPQPLLYARLAAQTRQLATGLDSRGVLEKGMGERLNRLARLLDRLQAAAERELRGEAPTAEDLAAIAEALPMLAQLAGPVPQDGLPFVADVYQNPQNGLWLQAALGDAWLIYVLVPLEGRLVLAAGAVPGGYEFARPGSERWTNAAWQVAAERGPALDFVVR